MTDTKVTQFMRRFNNPSTLQIRRLELLRDTFSRVPAFEDPLGALVGEMEVALRRQGQEAASTYESLVGTLGSALDLDDLAADWDYDDQQFVKVMREEIYKLAVVGLYKRIEISVKSAVVLRFPNLKKNKKLGYYCKKLKDYEIELEAVKGFDVMSEIRELNNCIKHDDFVSGKLENLSGGWKEGDRLDIDNVKPAFDRLLPESVDFPRELIKLFILGLQSTSSSGSSSSGGIIRLCEP